MDIGTLIGLVSGIAIIGAAIVVGGDIGNFINLPGLLIVLGGTMAATFIKFTLSDMVKAMRMGARTAFVDALSDPARIYEQALALARVARGGNLLNLQQTQVKNSLLRHGIQLAVDGHKPDFILSTLKREAYVTRVTAEKGERMFRGIGESAPAFGMIGTLVGLVQMLSDLQDPASIGPAMAIAMLTTFYGALIANLIALPIADKLAAKIDADHMVQDLVIESMAYILKGENPSIMAERLAVYLPSAPPQDAEDAAKAQADAAAQTSSKESAKASAQAGD